MPAVGEPVTSRLKHAGLLAHSTEGAALAFLTYCQEGFRRLGRHEHPDVTLDYIAFGYSMPAWEAGDHASVRATLATSVARLARAGADFFACPESDSTIWYRTLRRAVARRMGQVAESR
jgi:aspartate/glutamate racemase